MEQNQNQNPAAGERTFTQEEVNRIVSERLAKERNKADAALVEREQQLAKRERLFNAREKIAQYGLPANLVDVLDTSSDEAFDKALTAIGDAISQKKSEAPRIVENRLPDVKHETAEDADEKLRSAMGLPTK